MVSSLDGARNGWQNENHTNEPEVKENGSLIGSSVSESEASSNDFRAIDDILPNEPFEDEGKRYFILLGLHLNDQILHRHLRKISHYRTFILSLFIESIVYS